MVWIISGTDQNGDVWVVRAENRQTAAHIADMFTREGYRNVTIESAGA